MSRDQSSAFLPQHQLLPSLDTLSRADSRACLQEPEQDSTSITAKMDEASSNPSPSSSRNPSRPPTPPNSVNPADVRSQAIAKLKRAASLPRQANGRRPNQLVDTQHQYTPASLAITTQHGEQEVLSPSPIAGTFDHAAMYPTTMQRSLSSSSSYHSPTPPAMTYNSQTPYTLSPVSSTLPTHDYPAIQLAQSYLPSLSPVGLSSASFLTAPASGRNTPSPLPTLGELRTLQRSNSNAARAHAMSKLTGGKDTPTPATSDEGHGSVATRPQLQRADTFTDHYPVEEPVVEAWPKLQRSFTVSSSNMGEERRSAVGRRMVARLGKARAERNQEQAEIRHLWEEKRRTVLGEGVAGNQSDEIPDHPVTSDTGGSDSEGGLGVPDKRVSRITQGSNGEAFEYDSHLRRSLSARTARGALAVVGKREALPSGSREIEQLDHQHYELERPSLPFATPSRHTPSASTSTDHTVRADGSPESAVSRDGFGSMMFVLGSGSAAGTLTSQSGQGSWPSEVEESGGSDWGTPVRGNRTSLVRLLLIAEPTFATPGQTPTAHPRCQMSNVVDDEDSPSPSERHSGMSWEEVGGATDLEVPSDMHYHKKSGSMSANFKRTVQAMRNRTGSRSSETPPTSPRQALDALSRASSKRRGSETSTSPSAANSTSRLSPLLHQGEVSHKPSNSSLASGTESSANSLLLQHQLAHNPSPIGLVPRAELGDPRIHSSKLSPFPGIERLSEGMPTLVHQASDSAVPTQQHVQTPQPIYTLPLPVPTGSSRRGSAGSGESKRNWLAKAFTSPRSSATVSRTGSTSSSVERSGRAQIDADPFAAPPPPPNPIKHRSASPAVSTVLEAHEPPANNNSGLPPKSMDVLMRMDRLLASGPEAQLDILDDPPRKLLAAAQILQVVNANVRVCRKPS